MSDRALAPVLVNLNHNVPPGHNQLITRLKAADVNKINSAAAVLNLRQSEFTRLALVRVAEVVLSELKS